MKAFNGYDEARKQADLVGSAKLPAGAYVCKVKQVRYETNENGDRIVMAFDVSEGEYKNFFQKQFEANTSEDKKWKGRVNIFVPKDDGTESDGFTKKSFAGWTSSFEKSNEGYKWDWNENSWVGLTIGIVFGETGTRIDGKDVIYTEARFGVDAKLVRDGKAPEAKFKAKNGYNGSNPAASASGSDDSFMKIPASGKEEIPF